MILKRLIFIVCFILTSCGVFAQPVNKEWYCLAQNIHYEAEGESFIGKLAVGIVTLNRQKKSKYTICEIVFQPKQFSWTSSLSASTYNIQFSEDTKLAATLINERIVTLHYLELATYFHNIHVNPKWIKNKKKIAIIGNHVFYTDK